MNARRRGTRDTTLSFPVETSILKLLLVPPFIAGVSLAGRRWGPSIGGWLIGLPMNASIIVLFVALEQGDSFASRTAQASLLGTISLAFYCLAYSRLRPRVGRWYWAMVASLLVFSAVTFGLDGIYLPVLVSFPIVAVLLFIVRLVMPKVKVSSELERASTYPRWDIPLRMVAATSLVFLLTEGASQLGPQLTGLLAPFPVYATVLTSFIDHLEGGGEGAIRFLRGLAVGLYTFATFFLVLGLTLLPFGIAVSFGLALVVSLVVHFCSLTLTSRTA